MSGFSPNRVAVAIVAGSLFIGFSAGCGTRVGPTGNPNETPTPAPKESTPVTSPSATPSAAPTPTPIPTPPPELQASQKSFKERSCFIICVGEAKLEVSVTNPHATTLSGTVKVSFTKKGSPTGDDQEKPVSLGASQTETLIFTTKKGNPDSANITVVTQPPAGGAPGVPAPPVQDPYRRY